MSVATNSFSYRIILKSIIILLLMISLLAFVNNRSEFVCGKFNGYIMEVPSRYIYGDINHKEATGFYKNSFEKYGLPPASAQPEIDQWLWVVSDMDNIGIVGCVIGNKLIEKLSEIRDWLIDLTLPECYPNSMLCEMSWRPNVSESLIENPFHDLHRFSHSEFSHNAPMPSRLLTNYHMAQPYYGLAEIGLFGGSSYNSAF